MGKMVATSTKKITFEEYLKEYPQGEGFFELVDGELIKMEAIRAHKNISRFLVKIFGKESERLELDYIIDKDIVVRTVNRLGKERGRIPDVSVVKASLWNNNVITYGAVTEPLELAVEVVSTNWEDDYIDKLEEYETISIKEYWIVDYLAIASRSYLGNPKVPMIFVYQLKEGKYEGKSFKNNEQIISCIFPKLTLTVEEIIKASGL